MRTKARASARAGASPGARARTRTRVRAQVRMNARLKGWVQERGGFETEYAPTRNGCSASKSEYIFSISK